MTRKDNTQAVVKMVRDWTRALVGRPEAVRVDAVTGATVVVIEVAVAPSDVRRIIGRSGATADAIRAVLTAAGGRNRQKYLLSILEPRDNAPAGQRRDAEAGAPTSNGNATKAADGDQVFAFENDPIGRTGELLRDAARELVDFPAEVKVEPVEGKQVAVFEVSLDQRDVPRILGRGGRTVSALRVLMKNLGAKVGRRYILDVVEPAEKVS